MFSGLEIGRIAGIPIYLDLMFVLVLLVFTYPYFTSGNTQLMSAGFHHRRRPAAVGPAARAGTRVRRPAVQARACRHIELTGIGGIAHFERSLPRSALARSVISLAGPAVNLGCGWGSAGSRARPRARATAW